MVEICEHPVSTSSCFLFLNVLCETSLLASVKRYFLSAAEGQNREKLYIATHSPNPSPPKHYSEPILCHFHLYPTANVNLPLKIMVYIMLIVLTPLNPVQDIFT